MSTPQPQASGRIAQSLIPEFDHEMATTRKCLERIPADKFDYKPHAKSGTMGWLAGHIGEMLNWGVATLTADSYDMNPPGGPPYQPAVHTTNEALLAAFDTHRDACRAAILGCPDADMMNPWSLLSGGQAVMTMPRIAVLRGVILNHIIHHRGQLTVYMRENDIPVPSIYGPSADDRGM
jgi:uncharacterized damage-inducible protein DinB